MNFANLKIGHVSKPEQGTGITVFLPDNPVPCGCWLCGSAPATRDVNLLDPGFTMDRIDALVLTGGSAYGLGATNGVMQWLQQQQRGYQTNYGVVPIVPTAGIFDFLVEGLAFPTAEDGYRACQDARKKNTLRGRIGAGTGATVGKWLENGKPMSGGFGFSQLTTTEGTTVLACAVVNSVGDVINEQGRVVAGAVNTEGEHVDAVIAISAGQRRKIAVEKQNTTLVAVFTDALFSKAELTRIAKMASAGIARGTLPAFTRYDGDLVFAASIGKIVADEVTIGTLAAKTTHLAILDAVKDSKVIEMK